MFIHKLRDITEYKQKLCAGMNKNKFRASGKIKRSH